jgi:hypothetical protein
MSIVCVFGLHLPFRSIEQLQSCKEGFCSMRLVSVYLCLVRIVEVMLQFELNSGQDEHNLAAV